MKAAMVQGQGRAPVYADFPAPVAGEGERLIEVTAAALTPLARGRASGAHYSSSGVYPFVAGVDGVGRLADGGRVYFLLPRRLTALSRRKPWSAPRNACPCPTTSTM